MMTTHRNPLAALDDIITVNDPQFFDGKVVVDFDFDVETDYEVQSGVVIEDGRVAEAAVRFGRIPTYEDIGVGRPILADAWINMVHNHVKPDGEFEADLSDFGHNVPHFRVSDMDVDEFVRVVHELHELVETVFRSGEKAMDQQIDDYL